MHSKLKINIGDHAKVIINGQPKELEVVDVIRQKSKSEKTFSLSLAMQKILDQDYLEMIIIELPNGQIIDCRPLQPMF